MRFLSVKNFARFQHYRDRNPPWIKLYTALLSDPEFLQLHEAAQAQVMKLWLLAAQMGHPLPNNPKLLAGKIGCTGRFYLSEITAAGFITPCDEVASEPASTNADTPLAKPKRKARGSVRARGRSRQRSERESEREQNSAADAAGTAAKRERPKRDTWITPFAEVWHDLFAGTMPIQPSLKPLKRAVDELGAEEALRRWEIYLSQTSAQFASAARFESTLGEWEAPKPGGRTPTPRVDVSPLTQARAAELFGLGREYKLLQFDGNRSEYSAAVKRASADARAGEAFKADFEASRMWEGVTGLPDGVAIKEIARRLELAHAGNGNGTAGKSA